ncbi:LacI family DNA-binding transcriptional regulator [Lactovum odontotermitis]
MKKITIKDIARIAGVSVSTVSRVLNGDSEVSEKTKKRVEKIIYENNYHPSMLARGMVSKKTKMIAIIVSDITNPYFNQFVSHIDTELMSRGYTLSLFDTQTANRYSHKEDIDTEINIFRQIQENNFEAVLLLGGLIDYSDVDPVYQAALHTLSKQVPVIVVGRDRIESLPQPQAQNIFFVARDQKLPTQLLVSYLIQKNYKQLAFVGGSPGVWITQDRTKTFRQVLSAHHLTIDKKRIINNDFYANSGYEAVTRLINENVKFDAIVAINDRVAQGALRALKDFLGHTVSKGVASCEYFSENIFNIPRITSVDHNVYELSQRTVNLLISILQQDSENEAVEKSVPKLIIGESC